MESLSLEGNSSVSRRSALKLAGGAAVVTAGAAVLAACGSAGNGGSATTGGTTTPSSSAAAAGGIKVTGGTGKSLVQVSADGQTVTMTTRGSDCWGTNDTCTFLDTKASGDGTWIVQVTEFDGTSGDGGWGKAGIMARESLDDTSQDVFLAVTIGNGIVLQYRESDGANEGTAPSGGDNDSLADNTNVAPQWLKLVKSGQTWTGYYGADGKTWSAGTAATTPPTAFPTNYLIGLAGTSHDAANHGTAIFKNWTGPALGSADAVGTADTVTG